MRNAKLSASPNGCQSGEAIVVQSMGGETSIVTIDDNSVHDFQKNGITANELGTDVKITITNVVTGLGPTAAPRKMGFKPDLERSGSVLQNAVSDNV